MPRWSWLKQFETNGQVTTIGVVVAPKEDFLDFIGGSVQPVLVGDVESFKHMSGALAVVGGSAVGVLRCTKWDKPKCSVFTHIPPAVLGNSGLSTQEDVTQLWHNHAANRDKMATETAALWTTQLEAHPDPRCTRVS
eukprot:TRINITY_DN75429_c0_g1_i1.p1 TRINITY_DN75429_c0_g1~~TRINITY_DN75429_c0_g1_i1.p1  ORF type:complete len:137 (+),score=10.14 TRINITY_DN75429_c0_g1_i1:565-975(+)